MHCRLHLITQCAQCMKKIGYSLKVHQIIQCAFYCGKYGNRNISLMTHTMVTLKGNWDFFDHMRHISDFFFFMQCKQHNSDYFQTRPGLLSYVDINHVCNVSALWMLIRTHPTYRSPKVQYALHSSGRESFGGTLLTIVPESVKLFWVAVLNLH